MRRALYAGSFDPPTNGHVWMIEEGAKLFDELYVAVGTNPEKKPMFSFDERFEVLENMIACNNVHVVSFPRQYLVHFARQVDAQYLLRGIRNENDYLYERSMHNVNRDMAPDIETIYLFPPRELAEVSSSFVKGMIGPEHWEAVVRNFVPWGVYQMIQKKMMSE